MAYTGRTVKRLLVPGVGAYKKNKYNAKKTFYEGHFFDSKAEARRFRDLKLLERAGEIADIKIHPKYQLFAGGKPIATYRPDFTYVELKTSVFVAEDVKSKATLTEGYSLRRRMFIACYPKIDFREIFSGQKLTRLRRIKRSDTIRKWQAQGALPLTRKDS